MNLPIRFPNAADVIVADIARYQALSPEEKVHELCEMVELYYFLAETSPNPEAIAAVAEAQETAGRKAILAFAARHS